jgi:putative membrane protein insertion efficiency factor
MTVVRSGLLGVIRFYSRAISPALPPRCRFYPTCSAYAAEAITRHGAGRGSWLALRRLLKCGPWHPGGVDLVPGAGTPGDVTPADGTAAAEAEGSPGTSGTSHSSSTAEALPASPAGGARRPDLATPPRRRRAPHEESSVA